MGQREQPPRTAVYAAGTSRAKINREIETVIEYTRNELEGWLSEKSSGTVKDAVHDSSPRETSTLIESTLNDVARTLVICHDRPDMYNRWYGLASLRNGASADNNVEHVVVARADRIVINSSELSYIKTLTDAGVTVHMAEHGVSISKVTTDAQHTLQTLLTGPEVTPDGIKHTGGRPPIGFEVENGILQPKDGEYEQICRVLQAVRNERLSKREAASRLGCVRKTISNALDRAEMYRLAE